MRRLTIEFSMGALSKFGDTTLFQKIKWMEVLHFLELNEEVAMIVRMEFKDPKTTMEDLVHGEDGATMRLELLQREKGGICTYFMRTKVGQVGEDPASRARDFLGAGGYLSTPYEVRDGKVRVTFIGDAKQLKRFVEFVDKAKVPYKVVSLEAAKFSWKAPLGRLTEKQKRILMSAYHLGYYDIPKKTSIEQLARMLHIAPSTLDVELRRGERRLLVDALSET